MPREDKSHLPQEPFQPRTLEEKYATASIDGG
jgi:hypothetical protein